ncbi:MAG: ABC transporter permease [Anaerolineaceae bacterium]|nr:ABC transporter permease [Anaerolineaceae bacterium]HNX45980.1 ABC transporter permease [Anaerolineaceae bacterium]HPT23179.1 ABC transporter permease [Anaerolineaceae bacterium]
MRLPYSLQLVKRTEETPKWLPAVTSLGAVVVAFVFSGIVLALMKADPLRIYQYFFRAAFGSWGAFSDVVVKATPLILIGLGCSVAFRMHLWNIGAEGQFYIGAFFASLVVLVPLVPLETTPKFVILSLMAILGLIGGAVYGFIPGVLKARFNINEVITTLMLNYIAVFWNNYWIFGKYSDAGFQMTRTFPNVAWLPRLADLAKQYPVFSGITLHLGVVFGLVAAVIVWLIVYRSRWGYKINLIGDNPRAARYAGIDITRNIILVFMFSGALAGLAGMAEVSGVVHRLQERISTSYGFSGVIVAWLAKLNPYAVIVVSILFGALIVAGREIQPSGVSFMIQGTILFLVISSDVLLKYHVRLVRTEEETA